ncbi:hypothetical protein Noda2021_05400 [Candidatus Dependentiae bacterium Noda2021]|nr:hypothetical protein Noda2021_05400 [Candidatus Dependentiae bacterium Noda2021]
MYVLPVLIFLLTSATHLVASEKKKPYQVPHTPSPYEYDDTLPMTPRDPTMYESLRDKTKKAFCCLCIKNEYDDLD